MSILKLIAEEQKKHIESILCDTCHWTEPTDNQGIYVDDWISFDQMAKIVDYLRGLQAMPIPSGCKTTANSYYVEYDLRDVNHNLVMRFCEMLADTSKKPYDFYYGQYVRSGKIII